MLNPKLTDPELYELGERLGIGLHGMSRTEIRHVVMDAQRFIQASRLWWIALSSAVGSILSAAAALIAVLSAK